MRHIYFIVILLLIFSSVSYGQKILTTNSGQRILLVDDGSWRVLSATESINGENTETGTSLDVFKSPSQGKYPISSDKREEVNHLLANLLSDEAQLMVNIEMAKQKLNQLKQSRSTLKEDKDASEKVKYQIEKTKVDIENNEKLYKSTSKLVKISNQLLEGKVKNREKAFASIKSSSNSEEIINSGMGGANDLPQSEKIEKEVVNVIDKKYPTTFSIEKNSKDDYDCEIVFDGYDNAIGSNRKEVKTQRFFSYSQEKMKPYFKTEDFLNCDANISKVGKKYYLTLKIRIRSKDANKTYGILRANENIKLALINGRNIYGVNINSDDGKIESYTGHTLYNGIFQLSKADINELKKNYLDHIGIVWSSGYEQYDIYNVDFLTNQLGCLTK